MLNWRRRLTAEYHFLDAVTTFMEILKEKKPTSDGLDYHSFTKFSHHLVELFENAESSHLIVVGFITGWGWIHPSGREHDDHTW